MFDLSLQSIWVWILLGTAAAIGGWWALMRRPSDASGRIFVPAVGLVLVLLLVVYFRGVSVGQLHMW